MCDVCAVASSLRYLPVLILTSEVEGKRAFPPAPATSTEGCGCQSRACRANQSGGLWLRFYLRTRAIRISTSVLKAVVHRRCDALQGINLLVPSNR